MEKFNVYGYTNLGGVPRYAPEKNLIPEDFSSFVGGATVKKTFPIDVFKGNKNLALESGGDKRFDETHPTSITYYDEVEHLNYEWGTNLLLKSSKTVLTKDSVSWFDLQDKTWREL